MAFLNFETFTNECMGCLHMNYLLVKVFDYVCVLYCYNCYMHVVLVQQDYNISFENRYTVEVVGDSSNCYNFGTIHIKLKNGIE